MTGFFLKRPGFGLLAVVVFFMAGGVMAHHSGPRGKSLPSLATRGVKAPPAVPEVTWQDRMDLDRLTPKNGKLVHVQEGGTLVTTTLDPHLQAWARKTMASFELPYAAMVLTDLDTGKVLVLAGHSSRNAKVDTESLTLTPWAPAASVFKLVTASALLSRGVPAQAQTCYHGGLHGLEESNINDNPKLDTACRTLSFAVAKSVNPIMAKLSLRYLGTDRLKSWAERFGFNRPIPFDLPVQPSKAAIPKNRLELARVSAGFWHTEISPLHGALIAGVAASDGVMRWPHVVDSVTAPDGTVSVPKRLESRRVMDRGAASQLSGMMLRTTTMGTARGAFQTRKGRPYLGEISVAGKTGSLSRNDPFLHYNWFVGFAPQDRPRVAFSVLVGNPAKWRIKATTAARMLLQEYFAQQKEQEKSARKVASAR